MIRYRIRRSQTGKQHRWYILKIPDRTKPYISEVVKLGLPSFQAACSFLKGYLSK